MIDHGDPDLPALKCDVFEAVEVGPVHVFFSNQNLDMGLKSHSHAAQVWLVFETLNGGHGYPSFEVTNDALRAHVLALTNRGLFTKATNEDVTRRLFAWVDDIDWTTQAPWAEWGGEYRLLELRLAVQSNHDRIGHDNGVTTYSVRRHPLYTDYRQRHTTVGTLNMGAGQNVVEVGRAGGPIYSNPLYPATHPTPVPGP